VNRRLRLPPPLPATTPTYRTLLRFSTFTVGLPPHASARFAFHLSIYRLRLRAHRWVCAALALKHSTACSFSATRRSLLFHLTFHPGLVFIHAHFILIACTSCWRWTLHSVTARCLLTWDRTCDNVCAINNAYRRRWFLRAEARATWARIHFLPGLPFCALYLYHPRHGGKTCATRLLLLPLRVGSHAVF